MDKDDCDLCKIECDSCEMQQDEFDVYLDDCALKDVDREWEL
jgi:hypothetical protein